MVEARSRFCRRLVAQHLVFGVVGVEHRMGEGWRRAQQFPAGCRLGRRRWASRAATSGSPKHGEQRGDVVAGGFSSMATPGAPSTRRRL